VGFYYFARTYFPSLARNPIPVIDRYMRNMLTFVEPFIYYFVFSRKSLFSVWFLELL